MQKLILITLILFQIGCTTKCNKNESKTAQEIIENIKIAGTDDHPVSPYAQKTLDQAVLNTKNESKVPQDLGLLSPDCKDWQQPNSISVTPKVFFTKKANKSPALINENESYMISADPFNYSALYNDAFIILSGARGFSHRQIKPGILEKGLAGILQGMAIVAGESDEWKFGIGKTGETVAMVFLMTKEIGALEPYHAIVCSKKDCLLIKNRGHKILTVNSPEALALKKKDFFIDAKIQALYKTCEDLTSKKVIDDFQERLLFYKNSCNLKITDTTNFDQLKVSCDDFQKQVLPLLRKFQ